MSSLVVAVATDLDPHCHPAVRGHDIGPKAHRKEGEVPEFGALREASPEEPSPNAAASSTAQPRTSRKAHAGPQPKKIIISLVGVCPDGVHLVRAGRNIDMPSLVAEPLLVPAPDSARSAASLLEEVMARNLDASLAKELEEE